MKKLTLGIDVGITSIGWGIVDEDFKIIDQGVRLFQEADSELNAKRRTYRSNRRLKRRKRLRILAVKKLLIDIGLIDTSFRPLQNPYDLRVKGLTKTLNNQELATVILHVAKRRGSSLQFVEDDNKLQESSTKALLSNNEFSVIQKGSVAEVQLNRLKTSGSIRGIYNQFKTDAYIDELKKIFLNHPHLDEYKEKIINIIIRKRHYSHGPGNYNHPTPYGRYRSVNGKLLDDLKRIIQLEHQHKYKSETFDFFHENVHYLVLKSGQIVNKEPYDLLELMRGKCSIYPEEPRAPKFSFSAELFNLLNDLNNLKFIKRKCHKLSTEEKLKIINLIKEKGDFKPKGFKGLLKLIDVNFDDVRGYRINDKSEPIITEFIGYKKILKIMENHPNIIIDENLLDSIAEILTLSQLIEERKNNLIHLGLSADISYDLAQLGGFNGFHSLSLKAIKQLNQEMLLSDLNQMQIITNQKIKQNQIPKKLEFNDELILSPVVKRAHRESIKVINDLIKEFGEFDKIVIETTRSKNSKDERLSIQKIQKQNLANKKVADELLESYGYDSSMIKGQLSIKLRLYNEQNGKCIYTGNPIDIHKLINDHQSYEIDHIIPYSISLDDSYNNKVLVTPSSNQLKGNKTPYGYFKSGMFPKNSIIQNFDNFKQFVLSHKDLSNKKRDLLLLETTLNKFNEMESFINRNLVDTSYAIRSLMTTLKNYFMNTNMNTKIYTVKGKITSTFRSIAIHEWNKMTSSTHKGINPMIKDRDYYRHHAIDALIIAALINQGLFRTLFNLDFKEGNYFNRDTGELYDENPLADTKLILFLKDLSKIKDEDVRFSWKIDSKPNRSFTDETLYSTRLIDGEHRTVNKHKDIYTMKSSELSSKIFDEKRKKDLLIYRNDPKTFELLENIYNQYKHTMFPFKEYKDQHGYIKKFSKNNTGPIITSLKFLAGKNVSYVDVSHNYPKPINKKVILLSVATYRIDIYRNDQGHYKYASIRYNDLKYINNRYEINMDKYNAALEKKGIDSSFKFEFSVYRNDILQLTNKNGEMYTYRFVSVKDDSKNIIELKHIDKRTDQDNRITPSINSSITSIKKFHVSSTGKYQKVSSEVLKTRI